MKLFGIKNKKNYTIVVGCGRLGAYIANSISNQSLDVTIIDKDESSFRKLALSYGGLAIVGNAINVETFIEAGIEKADSVVVVTDSDNINIMTAQLIKTYFNVPNVIIRLYDPEIESVYRELGIKTVCPSVLSANKIESLLEK
ncbi:potassium channel family protein [Peptostreptococcus russellii]|uniref:potassium channel family protein n=1 Tax=Peptostreptococcus russellii TaxID=215200 RepID=UPI0026EC49F2|nr:TrkA family potassium uptake protein [Peptostreptococcus russellii]